MKGERGESEHKEGEGEARRREAFFFSAFFFFSMLLRKA
jgi:hypothetical protein